MRVSKIKRYSKNKGITLISLIVTIIVLIILAGISVAVLTGDNGLINKAGEAKDSSERADEKEALDQAVVEAMGKNKRGNLVIATLKDTITNNIKNISIEAETDSSLTVKFTKTGNIYDIDGEGEVVKGMATVTTPPTSPVAENTKYNDGEDTAVIPKDFKVVQEGETKPTIEAGLVVKDSKENEWVWIPVDDVTQMYTTEGAPYTLCGTSEDTAVTASMASKSEILNSQKRTTPGTTSSPYYREPDLVVDSGGTSYDYANYGTAGFSSLQDMAQNLVKDYEEMIESVGKYGGFYVGRYELTGTVTSPTEVSGVSLINQDWYNLYKACKGFTTSEVESRMIWGCQWDMVCKYIATDNNYSITDSRSWGNYSNSTGNAAISGKSGSKQNTGFSEYWSAKKIYDIAGNCWEWTQEAYNTGDRAFRRRQLQRQWLWRSSF